MADPCPAEPDRERLTGEVRAKYRRAANDPSGLFAYPIGRAGAEALGYSKSVLDALPEGALARFVGVGCPFELRAPRPGERVLDVGCGAGLDVLAAARAVGADGLAAGVDLSPEMLAVARDAARAAGLANVRFEVASAEALPFDDASFDQIVSNGALNLVIDKRRAFAELARVLRPGGVLAIADLLVVDDAPARILEGADAWST
jgi:arsenite methyltransferase